MKKLIALLIPSVFLAFTAPTAQARTINPEPVSCWFYRGEKLELRQTCIFQGNSWAGGSASSLTWEDGVKTVMVRRDRFSKPLCSDVSLDKVCGSTYFRDPKTLVRISKAEGERRSGSGQRLIQCVEANNKSVCLLR